MELAARAGQKKGRELKKLPPDGTSGRLLNRAVKVVLELLLVLSLLLEEKEHGNGGGRQSGHGGEDSDEYGESILFQNQAPPT